VGVVSTGSRRSAATYQESANGIQIISLVTSGPGGSANQSGPGQGVPEPSPGGTPRPGGVDSKRRLISPPCQFT